MTDDWFDLKLPDGTPTRTQLQRHALPIKGSRSVSSEGGFKVVSETLTDGRVEHRFYDRAVLVDIRYEVPGAQPHARSGRVNGSRLA